MSDFKIDPCWLCSGTGIRPGCRGVCPLCDGIGKAPTHEQMAETRKRILADPMRYDPLRSPHVLEKSDKFLNWETVDKAYADRAFQDEHRVDYARSRYLKDARECPKCRKKAEDLCWVYADEYFMGHGCPQGWFTFCDSCRWQIDSFPTPLDPGIKWRDILAIRFHPEPPANPPNDGEPEVFYRFAFPCLKCMTPPEKLSWVFWSAEMIDWGYPPDARGWYSVCDRCRVAVESTLTMIGSSRQQR